MNISRAIIRPFIPNQMACFCADDVHEWQPYYRGDVRWKEGVRAYGLEGGEGRRISDNTEKGFPGCPSMAPLPCNNTNFL